MPHSALKCLDKKKFEVTCFYSYMYLRAAIICGYNFSRFCKSLTFTATYMYIAQYRTLLIINSYCEVVPLDLGLPPLE